MTVKMPGPAHRYYEPLVVPMFCYLWDAVMWVTFGRFPVDMIDDSVLEDELGRLSYQWKDSLIASQGYKFYGFRWYETEMAGIDYEGSGVDWERYERAMRGGWIRKEALEEALLQEKQPRPPDPHDPRPNRVPDEYWVRFFEQKLYEVPFVESVHRLYQHHIDRGWAKIFQALVAGEITGYGWKDMTQAEIRVRASKGLTEYNTETEEGDVFAFGTPLPDAALIGPLLPLGEMMEIPATDWSLSGIAPDARYVTTSKQEYWSVFLDCQRLFDLFPHPILTMPGGIDDSIKVLSPTLAISQDESRRSTTSSLYQPTKRGPGRRKLQDGAVERAVHELVGRRYAAGEDEASLHAEAAAFALKVWGVSLARSTFQGYMKPFKRLPEILPQKAAE